MALPAAQTDAELRADLVRLLNQPSFARAVWGVKVVTLRHETTLFETNSHLLLKPASNAKLFTGAMVLDQFGSHYRLVTSLLTRQPPDARGRIEGPLRIYGRGDPSMAARFHEGDAAQSLRALGQVLGDAGVRVIGGDLIGDETFFTGPPFGQGWTWSDLGYYYGAEVSALTSDDNVIDLTFHPGTSPGAPVTWEARPPPLGLEFDIAVRTVPAGQDVWLKVERWPGDRRVRLTGALSAGGEPVVDAVTVPAPAQWFMERYRRLLAEQGVMVEGQVRVRSRPEVAMSGEDGWMELARVESPELRELVRAMMKPSQNLYAHLLWLHAGALLPLPPADGAPWTTSERGRLALDRFLERQSIDPQEVLLQEGSGLSRDALVTPAAIVQLLIGMRAHAEADSFSAALPVAGVDGTLHRRMTTPDVQGHVRAKTGTLRHVLALSGYVEPPGGEPLVFSMVLNQFAGSAGEGRRVMDAVMARLVRESHAMAEEARR